MTGTARPHLVAVVAFDGVQLLDVTGPAEVFTTANGHGGRYDIRIVSLTGQDVRTSGGIRLGVDGPVDSLPGRLGTLLVPGRRDWRRAVTDAALTSGVQELAARSRRVASVCAGAFVLAEAGLLDGRRAATHWRLAGELAAAYPAVTVESDPLFVRDGRVITSAGITAGMDLALSLVEEDHGAGPARDTARELVVFMARPGGQSQFSARLRPREAEHPAVRAAMDAVSADPAGPHSPAALAGLGKVSARHLSRLFRSETGLSPAQYIASVRLEAAQDLLASGTDPIEAVAEGAGFGSAETMRRAFQQTLGLSPTHYRARFRTTAAAGAAAQVDS
ncbi:MULTISPECIES: GlxA family transcriptional regulator [Streptomyces]|uniref:Transcription regulator, AraC family protein n=1 Tax=Streptomyces badius TaxID=1941 RepID=A0ABQ2TRS9_STRBA|nr:MULTISPECIES: GlxA family transcriptional regulator [Streptomyces]GGS81095.1 putative transcription regulator, AraC family protein [Streptomyces badius]